MPNLNKVILIGTLTRDPESRYTTSGKVVANAGLAINSTYKNGSGEKVEEVTFVDIEIWGRVGEVAVEYAKKGQPICIEGRLKMDTWEDKQSGQKRSKLKVVAEGLQLLTPKQGEGIAAKKAQAAEKDATPRYPVNMGEDKDIPF
jgi:single-strand DNA-binding protein